MSQDGDSLISVCSSPRFHGFRLARHKISITVQESYEQCIIILLMPLALFVCLFTLTTSCLVVIWAVLSVVVVRSPAVSERPAPEPSTPVIFRFETRRRTPSRLFPVVPELIDHIITFTPSRLTLSSLATVCLLLSHCS